MCGIVGFAGRTPHQQPDALIARMAEVVRHRGPDGYGYYRDEFACLGHRRLSIIDLAGGHQPMTSEDGRLWIVFNGEIFNHAELRRELERAGHRYATLSDTETILHAYEQYGSGCVTRLRGMFAFAIWDRDARRLFCARDRLGKKPFYYYGDGQRLVFGSEIKALLEHPAVSPALDESRLSEHLHFGYTSGAGTLFQGIRRLLPGHHLTWEGGRLELRRYWEVPAPGLTPGERDSIVECRRRLEEAVRTRLMSDVPLGMFLSGGVDSSAIAALMKRLTGAPVKTFAVGYGESAYSELPYASQAAAHLGTEHEQVVVTREEFFEALPRLVWHEDEPLAWPSSVALHFVSRLAARQVKVVLTGEGSDELFAGYSRYRWYLLNRRLAWLYHWFPRAIRERLREGIARSNRLPAGARRRLGHTLLGRGENLESLYLDNFFAAFPRSEQRGLLRRAALAQQTCDAYLEYWRSSPDDSVLGRMLYADQKTYLEELLMKQDQMSMSASIESRVPFLDHLLVEFAASVPNRLKLRGATGKYILKRAVEDLLPREIIYRPKMGFPTPLRAWLADAGSDGVAAYLRRREGLLAGYVDGAALEALLDRHQRGLEDATDRIWRLLNLQIWGDLFLTGHREPVWEGLRVAMQQ